MLALSKPDKQICTLLKITEALDLTTKKRTVGTGLIFNVSSIDNGIITQRKLPK